MQGPNPSRKPLLKDADASHRAFSLRLKVPTTSLSPVLRSPIRDTGSAFNCHAHECRSKFIAALKIG
jgi:hypothetical protein